MTQTEYKNGNDTGKSADRKSSIAILNAIDV